MQGKLTILHLGSSILVSYLVSTYIKYMDRLRMISNCLLFSLVGDCWLGFHKTTRKKELLSNSLSYSIFGYIRRSISNNVMTMSITIHNLSDNDATANKMPSIIEQSNSSSEHVASWKEIVITFGHETIFPQ
jgi:hypothetical protein